MDWKGRRNTVYCADTIAYTESQWNWQRHTVTRQGSHIKGLKAKFNYISTLNKNNWELKLYFKNSIYNSIKNSNEFNKTYVQPT